MMNLFLLLVAMLVSTPCIVATAPHVHRECPRSMASQCARLKYHGCGMAAADTTKAACTCGGGFTAASDGCVPCTQEDTLFSDLSLTVLKTTSSAWACRAACQATDVCQFWSLQRSTGQCRAVDSNVRKPLAALDRDFVSGARDCGAVIFLAEVQRQHNQTQSALSSRSAIPDSVPLINVLLADGSRAVLQGLPASFGRKIDTSYKLYGLASMASPATACGTFDGAPTGDLPRLPDGSPVPSVAVVERGGGCTFAEKVKNVQDAGYAAVIILDNSAPSGYSHIAGSAPSVSIASVFLEQKGANKLRAAFGKNNALVSVLIQDMSSFSPFPPTMPFDLPSQSLDTPPGSDVDRLLDYDEQQQFPSPLVPSTGLGASSSSYYPTLTSSSSGPSGPASSPSPLSLVIIVPLAILCLVALVSVVIYCYRCKRRIARRRRNRTRCQQAIRDMEAYYRRQAREVAASGSGSSSSSDGCSASDTTHSMLMDGSGVLLDYASTAKLIECPVCLEVAWPPTKILQCLQGHIVCEVCLSHPQLKSCPMCRQKLQDAGSRVAGAVSRNLGLENLAAALMAQQISVGWSGEAMVEAGLNMSSSASASTLPTAPSVEALSSLNSAVDAVDSTALVPPEDRMEASAPIAISPAHSRSHSRSTTLVVNLPPDNGY